MINKRHEFIVKNRNGFYFNDDKILRKKTEEAIKELNENSFLIFKLLCPYNEAIIKEMKTLCKETVENYMSEDFYADGMYKHSNYPTVAPE
jgi:hypothetical protein